VQILFQVFIMIHMSPAPDFTAPWPALGDLHSPGLALALISSPGEVLGEAAYADSNSDDYVITF
jgi:hypothetical protein